MISELKEQANNIRKLYPKLAKHSDTWVLSMYESLQSHELLKEFVTQTIDAEKTIETIGKRFSDAYYGSRVEDNGAKIILQYKLPENADSIAKINTFLDTFGWFPALISTPGHNEKFSQDALDTALARSVPFIIVVYEAKYDTEETLDTDILYHLVPDIYIDKVELMGLTPKTKSKMSTHPERVYLMLPTDRQEYVALANQLWERMNPKAKELTHYFYLLRIDVSELKNSIKFYTDPNFMMGDGAVWTYKNIAPKYIEVQNKILVNPET